MTLTPGERYSITYREAGDEKEALAHYRGFGTADVIARGEPGESSGGRGPELHWFKVDGRPGYLTIEDDDLVSYQIAEGYGG